MRDHRNPRRPEARIVGSAGNLRAKFGAELAMHRRAMHADFLEQTSVHYRHHAAAAGLPGVVGAVPGRARKPPRSTGIERGRCVVLQPLEGRANVVAQGFEPAPRPRLAILDHGDAHLLKLILWAEIAAALVAAIAMNAYPRDRAGVLNLLPDKARKVLQRRRPQRLDLVEQLVV